MIQCLNDYFDRMATPVKQHGGEILKFIGDAMLAVFPLDTDRALRACAQRSDRGPYCHAPHGMLSAWTEVTRP